jgi:hypothetical protein
VSIIKKISECVYYYLDTIKAARLNVKIENFILNYADDNIVVVYRLGRQKLLNTMELTCFEKQYFEKISTFDQHRLTKFSTLQYLLKNLFYTNMCSKENLACLIEEHIKNEQLF